VPVLIVVPARVGSTRLPNKPLLLLGGAPLIHRVANRALQVPGADRVVVATDSDLVAEAVADVGVDVVMTRSSLASGTDRVAAVAARAEFAGFDIVVNLQGDEPFLPIEAVRGAIGRVQQGDAIGTAAAPLDPTLRNDPARVKVVVDDRARALYFSRAAIPHLREPADLDRVAWWQHLGIYAYRREVLLGLAARPTSPLERAERLEQLRALEAGLSIGVKLLDKPAWPGIDTPDDLAAAEARWPDFAEAFR
jgi:3-deoxy-manno-octulosonate cytidylyltransferase (CMP-KDO synthetase)